MVLPKMPLPPLLPLPSPPCAVPMVPPEMVSLPSLWMPSPRSPPTASTMVPPVMVTVVGPVVSLPLPMPAPY